jgi:hypothetical protein
MKISCMCGFNRLKRQVYTTMLRVRFPPSHPDTVQEIIRKCYSEHQKKEGKKE